MLKPILLAAAALLVMPAAAAFAADAAPTVISIKGMHFTPATLTVVPGTKVTWVNEDESPHTVTEQSRVFHSAALDTKDSFSYTFATPGEFAYFCTIHPMMTGKIVVKPAG